MSEDPIIECEDQDVVFFDRWSPTPDGNWHYTRIAMDGTLIFDFGIVDELPWKVADEQD